MKLANALTVILLVLLAKTAFSQSTATPSYPVILSTTTTGTYACPTSVPLPCAVPIDATHPLPATNTGN